MAMAHARTKRSTARRYLRVPRESFFMSALKPLLCDAASKKSKKR
jgi:hypothetical protein